MSKKSKDYEQKMGQALAILKVIAEDNTTPRNIRRVAKGASERLNDESLTPAVRASNAIDMLEEISQDPNMPPYTRVRIWNAISALAGIRDYT
ncbi:MAG: UPF0147 family protein [Candidatus Bathyarchaeia archaeon]